jgi:Spy/CpxP family protein refolding chaperone
MNPMITNNRQIILVWSIVILAVLNISTLATIAYHVYQEKQAEPVLGNTNTKQLETDTEQFSGRYFRDQLGFTADQMERFRAFNPAFRQEARAITLQLAENRKQMLDEMAREHSDTTKLNQLSGAIGTLHGRLKVLTYKYYLDMKHICTSEQQIRLEQLFRYMFKTDFQMGYPGAGNGNHGMGRGRNWNK